MAVVETRRSAGRVRVRWEGVGVVEAMRPRVLGEEEGGQEEAGFPLLSLVAATSGGMRGQLLSWWHVW